VLKPPIVRRFYPAYGPPGTRITLEGEGFINGDEAYVGNAMLTIRTVFDRKIVAELPGGVTPGRVYVIRAGNKYYARGRFQVIYAPIISNIDPRSAPAGAMVEITGSHFSPGTSVLLAGINVRSKRHYSQNRIQFRVPRNARTGEVVVVNRGGSAKSPFPFIVSHHAEVSSFFPLHGLPGSQVTIRGRHFHKGVKVMLHHLTLPIVRQSPEKIRVEIPQGARSGRFKIITFNRPIYTHLVYRVDKPKPELEFSFAPRAGQRGSEATLFISPPRQNVRVFYNDRPLPIKILQGGRQIVVTIPGDARSGYFSVEYNNRSYKAKRRFRVRY
jgi:hypothetical protein